MIVLLPEPLAPYLRLAIIHIPIKANTTYDQCCDLASRDVKRKVFENLGVRSGRVAKFDIVETDNARRALGFVSGGVKGIDLGLSIDQFEKLDGCRCRPTEDGDMWSDRSDGAGSVNDREYHTVIG